MRVWLLLVLPSVLCASLALPAAEVPTATVEGTVAYQPDAKRRWRYSRYYIADPKNGALAESVVALRIPRKMRAPAAKSAVTHTIDQVDFRFTPETIAIRLGDKVRFTNNDGRLHNVQTRDGLKPFNFNLSADDEMFHTFLRAGGTRKPIRLGCALHGGMKAWIFVFDHPWHQLTVKDGKYRFENVPPGEYELRMAHPAGELSWKKKITVAPNDKLHLDIHVSPDNLKDKNS